MNIASVKKIVKEVLAASFPGRGWEGKTEHIDKFLQEAYEFMTPSDKQLKDKVFHAYYRHYNDGDFESLPYGTLKKLGLSEDDAVILQNAKRHKDNRQFKAPLEKALDVTQKYLYKKYKNTVNRRELNYKKLEEIAKSIKDSDYKQEFWIKKFGEAINNKELIEFAKKLEELNKGTKDLKDLPDEDVIRIRRILRETLESRKPIEETVAA